MLRLLGLLISLLLGFQSFAAKPKINKNPLSIETVHYEWMDKENKHLILTLKIKLAKEHKAYADIFKVETDNSAVTIDSPEVSPLSLLEDKYNKGKQKLFFENEGLLKVSIKSKATFDSNLAAKLVYQACTENYCLLPKKINFEVELEPTLTKNRHPGSDNSTDKKSKKSFSLFFIFLFGLLTAFSPCVFPMVPITMGVLGFTNTSNRLKGFIIGLSYSLGLALTYSLIGLAAALSGGFIGQSLANPYIVWGIFIFYILMGLALLDIFSFKTPDKLSHLLAKIKIKGVVGAFLAGAIGGVIASPCVGPAVASILAHVAHKNDPVYGFIALFTYGMGLGSLFIAMGVFYGELPRVLKPGKWMLYTKYLLAGLVFLGAAIFIKPHISSLIGVKKSDKLGVWTPFTEEAYKSALLQNKPIIIDFYADWCEACKILDDKIFTKDFFVESSQGIVLLKFDATRPTSNEEEQLAQFEVYGLPTILFINDKGLVQEDLTLTGNEPWEDFKVRLEEIKKRQAKAL